MELILTAFEGFWRSNKLVELILIFSLPDFNGLKPSELNMHSETSHLPLLENQHKTKIR